MTQRDAAKIAGGVAIGIAVAVLLGVGVFGVNLSGDTKTDVTLSTIEGACVLGKATHVRVHKGKQLIWEIENHCPGASRTISVGNFRVASGPSTANDCSNAGPDYPFADSDFTKRSSTVDAATQKSNGSYKSSDGKIKIKAKGRGDLGESEMTYYFDICLDGTKADPTLVMER